MGFDSKHIRPIAVALLKKGKKLLAMKGYDSKKGETFYRLLGGGIEFWETAENTIRREFKEELGADIKVLDCLGVDENIFIYEGNPGHEIAFFFKVEFTNTEDYEKQIVFVEDPLRNGEVVWVDADSSDPIYPSGFRKFI